MPYMMQYVQSLRHPLHIGMWRSQLSVLKAFIEHCKQFFMPEFHEEMWDVTFDMAIRGTTEIKEAAGQLLGLMIFQQHSTERRQASIEQIQQLGLSPSCIMRKSFI